MVASGYGVSSLDTMLAGYRCVSITRIVCKTGTFRATYSCLLTETLRDEPESLSVIFFSKLHVYIFWILSSYK